MKFKRLDNGDHLAQTDLADALLRTDRSCLRRAQTWSLSLDGKWTQDFDRKRDAADWLDSDDGQTALRRAAHLTSSDQHDAWDATFCDNFKSPDYNYKAAQAAADAATDFTA